MYLIAFYWNTLLSCRKVFSENGMKIHLKGTGSSNAVDGLALITLKTWESGIIAFSSTMALKATGTQGAFPY